MKIRGSFKQKDILSLTQFDSYSLDSLFKKADYIIKGFKQNKHATLLQGSVIALLFFEPSTRTYNSFSSAVQRLGGGVIGMQDITATSMSKGESFDDTIRINDGYSDAIVIRHSIEGAAQKASDIAQVPVINGGDGANEHPTQTLLDLYTIHQKFRTLNDLTVVVGPDPLHSRTIRSLLLGLSLYKNNTVYVLSPKELRLSRKLKSQLELHGLKIREIYHEDEIPQHAQVWYWNRLQKERFKNLKDYKKNIKKFIITPELLKKRGNKDLIILDPLPRVDEIETSVDSDPRAYYFHQAKNGLFIRMALLASIFGKL